MAVLLLDSALASARCSTIPHGQPPSPMLPPPRPIVEHSTAGIVVDVERQLAPGIVDEENHRCPETEPPDWGSEKPLPPPLSRARAPPPPERLRQRRFPHAAADIESRKEEEGRRVGVAVMGIMMEISFFIGFQWKQGGSEMQLLLTSPPKD